MSGGRTDTELKIADAKIQLYLANQNIDDEEIVRSCINSFISIGRSVTWAMQKESGAKTPLSAWYRTEMNGLTQPLLEFFNNRRVFTIHKGTIEFVRENYFVFDSQTSATGDAIFGPQTITAWVFDDMDGYEINGSHSAFGLCESYLKILDELVERWLLKRSELTSDGLP